MSRLSPKQRRVLREYIWQVDLGELSVSAWLRAETCPVSPRAWYGANYHHCEAFQEALGLYRQAGQRWQIAEESRTIEAAQRKLRLATSAAAGRIIDLVDNARGDMVKLLAAQQVLDRADVATASKGPSGQTNITELSDDELIAIARGGSGGGGAAAERGTQ